MLAPLYLAIYSTVVIHVTTASGFTRASIEPNNDQFSTSDELALLPVLRPTSTTTHLRRTRAVLSSAVKPTTSRNSPNPTNHVAELDLATSF